MASARHKNRNYRRQPPPNSSPGDSDHGFQQRPLSPPCPPVIAVSPSRPAAPYATPLPLGSGDLGGSDDSSAARAAGRGDGKEVGEGEVVGRRGKGGGREISQSLAGVADSSLSCTTVESGAQSIRNGGFQNGAKRVSSGVGYNMLKSMGWRENTGLGQSSNGIVDPILPTPKPNHLGIGFNPTAAHDAAQEEIRHIQEAKREERAKKHQLKLEKAQVAEEEAVFMRESYAAVPNTSYEQLLESDGRLSGIYSDAHHSKPQAASEGHKSTELGQCPHCRQRFDTKYALKSHISTRHAQLLLAAKRQFKKDRKRGSDTRSLFRKRASARGLAPMSQDFSVYD